MPMRELTGGEIRLAHGLFGDSLDYAAIRIHDRGYARLDAMGDMSFGGHIYLPHRHQPDFSVAPLAAQRLFIHEMVHVWQHQNRVLDLARAALRAWVGHGFRYADAYRFRLAVGRDLLDYGLEQQPAIIEEYFLRQRGGMPMGRCLNDDHEVAALLEEVLGRFLQDPGYARGRVHARRSRPARLASDRNVAPARRSPNANGAPTRSMA